MNFIQKMFEKNIDGKVHAQFVRFSVGDYEPRAVLKIKNAKKTKVWGSFEYVNGLMKFLAEHYDKPIPVKGKIFLKEKIELDIGEKPQKKKGYTVIDVDEEIESTKLKEIYEKVCEKGYILLNIKTPDFQLKTKTKPHNPRGKFNEKYCTVTVSGEMKDKLFKELLFDLKKDFKEAEVKHRFLIEDIKIPKEFENDLALARIHAKRVGKLFRKLTADGEESESEIDFEA